MSINAFWLDGEAPVSGLDQLGIRSTSIRLYSHLVPGITNVTDRARYFCAHAYAVDLWARKVATNDVRRFRNFIRRIECLLCLAEKITAAESGRWSGGIVGTDRVTAWLRDCPSPLPDNLRIPIEKLEERYFGNRWGGFGQYYLGAESALRIIDRKEGLPRLVSPFGPQLADAFGIVADRVRFWDLINDRSPRISDLRRVGTSLGFSVLSDSEHRVLRDILLDSTGVFGDSGLRRRRTLLLLLSAAHQSGGKLEDPAWQILKAALYGRLSPEKPYVCPSPLVEHLDLWRTYALHEFLAFALEALLVVCIREVARLETDPTGPALSVAQVSKCLAMGVADGFQEGSFAALVRSASLAARHAVTEPPATNLTEVGLRELTERAIREDDSTKVLTCAFNLLARVAAHLNGNRSAYASFLPDTPVDPKRVGLDHLIMFLQRDESITESVQHWISLAANTHLRVATAKLAYNRDFTYKIAFENGVLRKIDDTLPAFSSPRLRQSAQMLADIGYLERDPTYFSIAPEGVKVLRSHGCLV
jgi:hypothetical protein